MLLSTGTEKKKKRFAPFKDAPKKPFVAALVAVGLLAFYLTRVAPSLVPVPPGIKVPFPAATQTLEGISIWCGRHQALVFLAGAGLLAGGIFARFSRGRYYIYVAVLSSLALTFTYLSISAPIDRLFKAVHDNLPKDNRVPSYSTQK